MRLFKIGLALVSSLFVAAPVVAEPTKKVLIVVSSEGRDKGKTRPGFEFDEFAQAWSIFKANGLDVEVASPAGGPAEADAFEADKVYNAAVTADPEAQKWLSATKATKSVAAAGYAGIYVIGGGGAMFDVYQDQALHKLLAKAYEAGTVLGGVCHGPAVFANVRLSDGTPLVKGRRLTGFTNAEESGFGKRWAASYPVFLETALKAQGATFEQTGVMLPFVVTDGRLVTGQNPFSTAASVEAMIRAMGKTPVARTPYQDERALLLVAKYLDGKAEEARAEFAAHPEGHDAMLIGIYGTIVTGEAGAGAERLAKGLGLMELAATRVSNPRLETAMAETEHRLGRAAEARARLTRILAVAPAHEGARKLLTRIGQ
jgi:putative intracellular protease/amidase